MIAAFSRPFYNLVTLVNPRTEQEISLVVATASPRFSDLSQALRQIRSDRRELQGFQLVESLATEF